MHASPPIKGTVSANPFRGKTALIWIKLVRPLLAISRDLIEGLFAAFAGNAGARRRSYAYGAVCIAFRLGAAIGAFATKATRAFSLRVPVTLLLFVPLFCARERSVSDASLSA